MTLAKMGKLLFEENQSYHLDLLKNKSPQDFLTLKKLIQKKIILIEDEVKDLARQALETISRIRYWFGSISQENASQPFY